jgi:hypothetical protein
LTLSSLSFGSNKAAYIQRDPTALPETTAADKSAPSLRQLTQQTAKHLVSTVSQSTAAQTSAMISAPAEPTNDSVRVSSTLGKAASSGRLTKEEAMAIYQKIAAFL